MTVRDTIDAKVETALLTVPAIDTVDIEPAGDPDIFPNVALFHSGDREIEREAGLTRREMTLTVEGCIEEGDGALASADRHALHAACVAAIMADDTLGGTVEMVDPTDLRLSTPVLASLRRLAFSQDFRVQFVTSRINPAQPAFFALRWLLDWIARRIDKRQAQLDVEHAALDMSWKEYRLQLERRIANIERQNMAFRLGFQHVSAALIRVDPQNPALTIAEKIMAQAFPDDFSIGAARAGSAVDKFHGGEE